MPRLKKVPCAHCDAKIVGGVSFCTNCEQPTIWASHEERTEWELRQWSQKRSPRPKRGASTKVADVTPIQSRRAAGPTPPIVKHPAAVVIAQTAPVSGKPVVKHPAVQADPVVSASKARPARATKPTPERVTPAAPDKKQVAKAKPERAPAKKAPAQPVASKAPAAYAAKASPAAPTPPAAPAEPVVMQSAPIDVPAASPATPDHAAEQTEILRELLRHVISIEEKINGNGSRRLRLLKRSG